MIFTSQGDPTYQARDPRETGPSTGLGEALPWLIAALFLILIIRGLWSNPRSTSKGLLAIVLIFISVAGGPLLVYLLGLEATVLNIALALAASMSIGFWFISKLFENDDNDSSND